MIDWCWHFMILGVHDSNFDISFKDVFDDPVGIIVWIKLKEQSQCSREEHLHIYSFTYSKIIPYYLTKRGKPLYS